MLSFSPLISSERVSVTKKTSLFSSLEDEGPVILILAVEFKVPAVSDSPLFSVDVSTCLTIFVVQYPSG